MENTEGDHKGEIEVKDAGLTGSPESVTYTTNGHKNNEKETRKSFIKRMIFRFFYRKLSISKEKWAQRAKRYK